MWRGLFFAQFGLSMYAGEVQRQLQGNPVIVEHIGEIESTSHSWTGTMEAAQQNQGSESQLAFEVTGSKASGTVYVVQDRSGDGTGIKSAILKLPNGTELPIDVGGGDAEFNELEIELNDLIETGEIEVPDLPVQVPVER